MPATPEPVSRDAPPLRGPVIMNQDWRDLTFLHWAVEPGLVERFVPPGVRPDVHDGPHGESAYVGLVPFRMVDAGVGRGPGVPWAGTFLETNVRLYSVDDTGRRGIVFCSLDTDRSVVVAGARLGFGLPYRWARMRFERHGDEVTYDARLRWPGPRPAPRSHLRLRVGAPREASALDDFLSCRWGLHVRRWGRTLHVPNVHEPWPLHDAEVLALDDGLVASVGLPGLAGRAPDHVAFSPGVHTVFGPPHDARRARRSGTPEPRP